MAGIAIHIPRAIIVIRMEMIMQMVDILLIKHVAIVMAGIKILILGKLFLFFYLF